MQDETSSEHLDVSFWHESGPTAGGVGCGTSHLEIAGWRWCNSSHAAALAQMLCMLMIDGSKACALDYRGIFDTR
jgi:hypothetical protein